MTEAAHNALTIRPAEAGDAAILASLMSELGYETRTAEMEMRLEMILKDSRYTTLVAVSEGRLCGMIGTLCRYSYEHNGPSGRILALVVTKAMRDRGVGRCLLAAAEDNFAARNIRRVAVNTRFERKEAHEFYDRMGYERNGFRFVKNLPGSGD
jgi:GNAT superfamily N-acetyltransferase